MHLIGRTDLSSWDEPFKHKDDPDNLQKLFQTSSGHFCESQYLPHDQAETSDPPVDQPGVEIHQMKSIFASIGTHRELLSCSNKTKMRKKVHEGVSHLEEGSIEEGKLHFLTGSFRQSSGTLAKL